VLYHIRGLSQEKQAYCLAPWEREFFLLYHTFDILGGYLAPLIRIPVVLQLDIHNLNRNKNVWLCVLQCVLFIVFSLCCSERLVGHIIVPKAWGCLKVVKIVTIGSPKWGRCCQIY